MGLRLVKNYELTPVQEFYNNLLQSDQGSSAEGYTGDVVRFIDWFGRHSQFTPQAVSTLDLVEYRTWMQKEGSTGTGLAPTTVNRNLNSLKSFFKFCHRRGYITYDPAKDIKLVTKSKKVAPKWLLRTEQSALVRAVKEAENLRDEAVVVVLLHTGLRISELSESRWCNVEINPRSGKIRVIGKGNKYREVPLNATARKILSIWAEKSQHTDQDYVFPGQNGALKVRSLFNIVTKYAYIARLQNVTPHTLRHTFCKNALDMGMPLTELAMIVGHSTLEVTRIYTVPSESDLQGSVEKMAWE